MEEKEIVDAYLQTAINLQLIIAKKANVGKVTLTELYTHIKKLNTVPIFDLTGFEFTNFIQFIKEHRDEFDVVDGELGVDVNTIGFKG